MKDNSLNDAMIVDKVTMSSVVEKIVDNDLNFDKFLKLHENLKL